jgi:hypothetical protein
MGERGSVGNRDERFRRLCVRRRSRGVHRRSRGILLPCWRCCWRHQRWVRQRRYARLGWRCRRHNRRSRRWHTRFGWRDRVWRSGWRRLLQRRRLRSHTLNLQEPHSRARRVLSNVHRYGLQFLSASHLPARTCRRDSRWRMLPDLRPGFSVHVCLGPQELHGTPTTTAR